MKEKYEKIKDNMILLGDEEYEEQMFHLVRPLLEQKRKTGYFESFDGTKLFYEYYEHHEEKATVVISHGFCEFTQKFEEVIFYFFQAGYSVFILDHRGHGYSERRVEDQSKVHIHSYKEYVQDFYHFIKNIVLKEDNSRKFVLYAHSMGGAIAALFLEQYRDIFSCAILSSPMLEMDCGNPPTAIVWLVMLFKKLIHKEEEYVSGHGAFDGIPHFTTSSCLSEERYNYIFSKRLQDRNYQTYGGSCGWTLASLKAVRKLQKNACRVKTPILLFQAGKDTTVKPGGQIRFANKSKHTRLILMPDSKHEIYNANVEIRKKYYQYMFEFIEENLTVTSPS